MMKTHTRLLKCALEVEDSRSYWRRRVPGTPPPTASAALSDLWFGPKSLPRVTVLLLNFRYRFDAFPSALAALHHWSLAAPASLHAAAPLICHWHTQLTDPLYRAFTRYLSERRASANPTITRDVALTWVSAFPDAGPWTMSTRVQFASKLLSAAYAAGLVASNSDRKPRPLVTPRVPDDALAYAIHLSRLADLDLDNDLLASVGLTLADGTLDARLARTAAIHLSRLGDVIDLTLREPDLTTWSLTIQDAA